MRLSKLLFAAAVLSACSPDGPVADVPVSSLAPGTPAEVVVPDAQDVVPVTVESAVLVSPDRIEISAFLLDCQVFSVVQVSAENPLSPEVSAGMLPDVPCGDLVSLRRITVNVP